MNNVLITGSTGFIGKRLVNAIESKNIPIRVISRVKHPNFKTEIIDLCNYNFPENLMEGVDTVFHLAGVTHDYKKNRGEFYKVNVEASEELCKLAAKSKVKKFIFVSSVKSSGSSKNCLHIDEKFQGIHNDIYGKSKREAELKLLDIRKQYDLHVSIIRPALVYGPGVKGNLELMMKGIKNGWFPPLPEIGNSRSMVHVDDVVRALLFVANTDKTNGEIYNVTDGVAHSSREIYEVMCFLLGKSIPKWTLPKALLKSLALMSPGLKYRIDKLLGDDLYCSKKLESLGFTIKRSLEDMNETIF